MSSEEQNDANRRNGNLSGRETAEVKVASSNNALKPGFLSREVLLPDEPETAFTEFARELQAQLNPQGELEYALSERIVGLLWRLRRAGKLEAGVLFWQRCRLAKPAATTLYDSESWDYDYVSFYRERAIEIDGQTRTNALLHAEKAKAIDLATLGEAYIYGENSIAKLSRYESAMQRNLLRALHELQRLQAARREEHVPAPRAIDVDVTGLPEPADVEEEYRPEE
jgi:hypothetical protein